MRHRSTDSDVPPSLSSSTSSLSASANTAGVPVVLTIKPCFHLLLDNVLLAFDDARIEYVLGQGFIESFKTLNMFLLGVENNEVLAVWKGASEPGWERVWKYGGR